MSLNDKGTPAWLKGLISSVGRLTQQTRSTLNMRSTVVIIKVNGKEHMLDTSAGLSDDILRQIASQAGISLEEATTWLQSSGVMQSLQQTAESSRVQQARGRVTMTVCAACHRKVPESATCLYCGQTLEKKVKTNEVDKKFLEADVTEDNRTQEKQQVRDTFEDRLKNL